MAPGISVPRHSIYHYPLYQRAVRFLCLYVVLFCTFASTYLAQMLCQFAWLQFTCRHSPMRPWLVFDFIGILSAMLCLHLPLPHCRDRILPDHQPPQCLQTPNHPSYIEDGYSITLTDAPKDFGGRLRLNCARTTPELPWENC